MGLVISSLGVPFSSCQVQFGPGLILQRDVRTTHKHLDSNKVIKNSQNEFVRNKVCQTNLISFFDGVTGLVDNTEVGDVMYLDLSEAFDTVQHDILISKLEKYGLDEIAISGSKTAEKNVLQEKLSVVLFPTAGAAHVATLIRLFQGKFCSLGHHSNVNEKIHVISFYRGNCRGRGGLKHFGGKSQFRKIYIN